MGREVGSLHHNTRCSVAFPDPELITSSRGFFAKGFAVCGKHTRRTGAGEGLGAVCGDSPQRQDPTVAVAVSAAAAPTRQGCRVRQRWRHTAVQAWVQGCDIEHCAVLSPNPVSDQHAAGHAPAHVPALFSGNRYTAWLPGRMGRCVKKGTPSCSLKPSWAHIYGTGGLVRIRGGLHQKHLVG